MEIWILVIVLLVIAIILLIASLFSSGNDTQQEQFNEYSVQQSEELYQIKSRLNQLEKSSPHHPSAEVETEDSITVSEISYHDDKVVDTQVVNDNEHEEIIRLYSQGYTMAEISRQVQKDVLVIEQIIDDYIESR